MNKIRQKISDKSTLSIAIIVVILLIVYLISRDILVNEKINRTESNTALSTTTSIVQDLLTKNYDSLYGSRKYFNEQIKKLHDTSSDMKFILYPSSDKQGFNTSNKVVNGKGIDETVINIGKYKLTITSPTNQDILDDEFFMTNVVLTLNNISVYDSEYKNVAINHIYEIQVGQTSYYLIGLCGGGTHGCGTLLPIVYSGGKVVVGEAINDVDFSNYLDKDVFFTKNGELYTTLDDSRYFFGYSDISNNASYNSAIPRIFKFDKKTGSRILAMNDFMDLYNKSTQIIGDGLNTLKNSIPKRNINTEMNTLSGKSLIPYFDYYLGMSIISNKNDYSKIRTSIEKLYLDFYGGDVYSSSAHFNGYIDFENGNNSSILPSVGLATGLQQYPNLTWKDKVISEHTIHSNINITYPEFLGGSTVTNLNDYISSQIKSVINNARESIGQMAKDEPELYRKGAFGFTIELNSTHNVIGVKNGVVSVELVVTDFTGGGNGNHDRIYTINWDLKSNRLLSLSDVICSKDPVSTLMTLIREQLNAFNYESYDYLFDSDAAKINLQQNFLLNSNGLIVVYQPYTIASGSAGIVKVPIPDSPKQHLLCLP